MSSIIEYTPPRTLKGFIRDHKLDELFYDWVVGPVGSGKTTAIFMKLVVMAQLQAASPDGIRRTRAVIVRNTMPQLKDTTLISWGYWFKDGQAGDWNATDKIFTLRFADVECIVMFRPLDTPDDISRVLSLEINFAIIDEFVEIPRAIVDALSARLGRYKQPDGTPVTIYGMWGSSNPSTEDNWWYDYLHGPDVIRWNKDKEVMALNNPDLELNAKYFHQPSALLENERENVENLPGKAKYYTNVMKGKSNVWIKQFVEAEWGFSVSGQPVVPGFRDHHLARKPLKFEPSLPLVIGFDPGLGGSAFIFLQMDLDGFVNVLGELVQEGYGAVRLINERLQPTMRLRFYDATRVIIAADPASKQRASTDERSTVRMFEDHYDIKTESNNRFPLRLNAIDHFVNLNILGEPCLRIDPQQCPILVRALKGGWRYGADVKKDILKGAEPEKNKFSHPGDAFGYGLRFFHKGLIRDEKHGTRVGTLTQRMPEFKNNYVWR